eukprot:gene7430-11753_t
MVSLTKLAEDYKNKQVEILQEGDEYYYFYPSKGWNRKYLFDQQFKAIYKKNYYVPKVVDVEAEIEKDEKVEKVKKQKSKVEEVPKQADEENTGSKYSVHVTFWRDTGDENKPIVPIREGTYTINAKPEHIEKLKNYKNIKNYTYNFVKLYVGDNHAFKNRPAKLIKYQTGAGPNRDQTVPIEQENYEFIRRNFIDYLPTELEKNLFELNICDTFWNSSPSQICCELFDTEKDIVALFFKRKQHFTFDYKLLAEKTIQNEMYVDFARTSKLLQDSIREFFE